MAQKIPNSIKIGNRNIKVVRVDYESPDFYYDEDKIEIQVNKRVKGDKAVEIFWIEMVRAIFDYVNLLNEIEKEVPASELPNISIANFGAVMKKVIEDNKLDK